MPRRAHRYEQRFVRYMLSSAERPLSVIQFGVCEPADRPGTNSGFFACPGSKSPACSMNRQIGQSFFVSLLDYATSIAPSTDLSMTLCGRSHPLLEERTFTEIEIFRRALPNLLQLDRYESRALSRRRFAPRARARLTVKLVLQLLVPPLAAERRI
jgi:hypothetical protein